MCILSTSRSFRIILLLFCGLFPLVPLFSTGPVFFDDQEAVSIYRDFDDGLFGRSLYRGVVFSVKLDSFSRYRSLPVEDLNGLTAYLLSAESAERVFRDEVPGLSPQRRLPGSGWIYAFNRDGVEIEFSLEKAPADLLEEVTRTYSGLPDVAGQVRESYMSGWIIRIHSAENVYRPEVARIDYEDILISASLLGDEFQPLWGIHDGNALLTGN